MKKEKKEKYFFALKMVSIFVFFLFFLGGILYFFSIHSPWNIFVQAVREDEFSVHLPLCATYDSVSGLSISIVEIMTFNEETTEQVKSELIPMSSDFSSFKTQIERFYDIVWDKEKDYYKNLLPSIVNENNYYLILERKDKIWIFIYDVESYQLYFLNM